MSSTLIDLSLFNDAPTSVIISGERSFPSKVITILFLKLSIIFSLLLIDLDVLIILDFLKLNSLLKNKNKAGI